MADNDSRTGVRYTTPEILSFVQTTHVPHDAALLRAFDAPGKEGMPAIQVGPSEGKALYMLLRLLGARKVVELGTLAGYSSIHMGRALLPGGMLYTVESEPKHAAVATANIAGAGLSDRITVVTGLGLDVLPTLEKHGPFDAVFIDADKGNYDKYGRWAAAHVRPGGLLLGDNAYFFGHLLAETDEAAAMRRFHQEAAQAFETVCLPTPDGLLLGIRR